jgi:hypothetical protein
VHAASAVGAVILSVLASGGEETDDHRVDMRAVPVDQAVVAGPSIDELEDGSVLAIRVDGGPETARGHVQQCKRAVSGFRGCTNRFPVLFDENAVAFFQYQVVDLGDCDAAGSCVLLVRDDGREHEAYAFTIFGGKAPPPPSVTLSPPGPYGAGDEVRVDVTNLIPGARIEAAFCGDTCASLRRASAGEDGTATAVVVIGPRCEDCGINVVAAAGSSFIETQFVAPPSADYDWPRLIAGLTAAAAFLVLAWLIVATVDWRPPSEAQTPELEGPGAG